MTVFSATAAGSFVTAAGATAANLWTVMPAGIPQVVGHFEVLVQTELACCDFLQHLCVWQQAFDRIPAIMPAGRLQAVNTKANRAAHVARKNGRMFSCANRMRIFQDTAAERGPENGRVDLTFN